MFEARSGEGGGGTGPNEKKKEIKNGYRNFEAHQNTYFVRLCCIYILTKHIFNYKIVKKIGHHCSRHEVPSRVWDREGDFPPPRWKENGNPKMLR